MAADILIVDDEEDIRELVAGILEDEGHGARMARNSDEAFAVIEARRPQLILLDIWLQGSKLDGLQLLDAVKKQNPTVPVVMISGHGNIETAVTAIKLGAYDFIEIAVSDNGKGFPSEDRRRLIEPYVTTRAEGTGLGLPIVVKIFEDHGGSVDLLDGLVRPDGGRGAMVLMKLPAPGPWQGGAEAASEKIGSS